MYQLCHLWLRRHYQYHGSVVGVFACVMGTGDRGCNFLISYMYMYGLPAPALAPPPLHKHSNAHLQLKSLCFLKIFVHHLPLSSEGYIGLYLPQYCQQFSLSQLETKVEDQGWSRGEETLFLRKAAHPVHRGSPPPHTQRPKHLHHAYNTRSCVQHYIAAQGRMQDLDRGGSFR